MSNTEHVATAKYWAARRNKIIGPFATRNDAEQEGHTLFPKNPRRNDVFSTGYGEFGPHFDIRFVNEVRTRRPSR